MTSPSSDGAAEVLRFGYGETALGTIALAQSGKGVAALFIGDVA